MTAALTRRLRRLLRRAARHPRLQPLAWRVRAWRRGRTIPPPRARAADRRARIAVPPRILAVESQLEQLAAGGEPIVAGPWEGSLADELLYWIPFLRWFGLRFGAEQSRITAVSRPGAESWYADVCGSYAITADGLAGRRLSPALLDAVCSDYWEERAPLVHVLDRLVYAPTRAPDDAGRDEDVLLWPGDDGDTGPFYSHLTGRPAGVIGRAVNGDAAALTSAVAGARLLVGPWSGRLLLGPMLGVPTLALTDPSSASPHLDLAYRAARALDSPLLLVDRSQIDLVTRLAPTVAG